MKDEFFNNLKFKGKNYSFVNLNKLNEINNEFINSPYTIKILTENIIRNSEKINDEKYLKNILNWHSNLEQEIFFYPTRALMQDFTGVPIVVDLATLRDKLNQLNKNPNLINPQIRVDLIIDHSMQVDFTGSKNSFDENLLKECERNKERYQLLKWAQRRFENFKVIPPGFGICHQINAEYLSNLVLNDKNNNNLIYPETILGADSHTPMINGLGIVGFGVGGIEVESVILGEPYFIKIPQVIGIKLTGEKQENVTGLDIALVLVEKLRKYDVIDKIIEFFGEGLKSLNISDKTTISNMTPEFGSMLSYFPVDKKTIDYFKLTNRKENAELSEQYFKTIGLFYDESLQIEYFDVIEVNLSEIKTSVAFISTPHNVITLPEIKNTAKSIINPSMLPDKNDEIANGSVVLAAITSCRTTANIPMIIGAGLLAKKAVEKGLKTKSYIKTSFTPGSKSVENYLKKTGLLEYLEKLNFFINGFGCGVCVGNSGDLEPKILEKIKKNDLNVTAVVSGNHNLDAKIHPNIKSNFLTSPQLVIAYAIAGNIDFDFLNEPLGTDFEGNKVFLEDIYPTKEEVEEVILQSLTSEMFEESYLNVFQGLEMWQDLAIMDGETFHWERESTYVRKPPFLDDFTIETKEKEDIENARIAAIFGDYITTDNILPVGRIKENSPAAKYLKSEGIRKENYNTYGARRGNHEVMVRGIFEGTGIKNLMLPDKEGGYTVKYPEKTIDHIYYVCSDYYEEEGISSVLFAGKEYGIGSSRDWAAKSMAMIGIKAIIAESFDRPHRQNLIGMGVLPLQFKNGENAQKFNLDGSELISILGIKDMKPREILKIKVERENGEIFHFQAKSRLDSERDLEYFKHGGILPHVLRRIIEKN